MDVSPVLRIDGLTGPERPGDSCKKPPSGGFSVEMMGFLGMGNNPMVGATVAVAVAVEEAMKG